MCAQIFAVVLSVNLFVNINSCQVAITVNIEPVSTHITLQCLEEAIIMLATVELHTRTNLLLINKPNFRLHPLLLIQTNSLIQTIFVNKW